MQKKHIILTIISIIVAASIVAAILLRTQQAQAPESPNTDEGQTFCTMDAKVCPDGSAVGRTGPDCEFSPCPGEPQGKPEQ